MSEKITEKITVKQGDITKLHVECIVNAANKSLLGGGGVDGAIHRAAGSELLQECRKLKGCETGQAKITGGCKLKASHVIHTVGPVYSGSDRDRLLLADCYRNSLELAKVNDIHSIAFPAISTGVYGYPKDEAVPIALGTVKEWLTVNDGYDISVIMCCFDKQTAEMYEEWLHKLTR